MKGLDRGQRDPLKLRMLTHDLAASYVVGDREVIDRAVLYRQHMLSEASGHIIILNLEG